MHTVWREGKAMSRLAIVGVGLVLLGAAGCVHDGFLAPSQGMIEYSLVVDNTPACVADVLEVGFNSVDVMVIVKRMKKEIRLVGMSKSGKVFGIFLRHGEAPYTTAVTVKWDREPDKKLSESIDEWLAVCERHGEDASKGK
jgi:hypothetical protein